MIESGYSFVLRFLDHAQNRASDMFLKNSFSYVVRFLVFSLFAPAVFGTPSQFIEVLKTIHVQGVFDGKGRTYIWKGEGDCSQTEGMPPMFELAAGSKLSNLTLIQPPDGIHVLGKNVLISNISIPDVCEDAVTIKAGVHQVTIKNSTFGFCDDKAITVGSGKNVEILNNTFKNCSQPVRLKPGSADIRISGNSFLDCQNAVRATGPSAFSFTENEIKRCKYGLRLEEKVAFQATDNKYELVTFRTRQEFKKYEFAEDTIRTRLDVVDRGVLGETWLKIIKNRHSKQFLHQLRKDRELLTPSQLLWYRQFISTIPKWEKRRKALELPFLEVSRPDKLELIFANRGGSDGFSFGLRYIGIDLQKWVENYGSIPAPNAGDRISRILSHEYTHLLTRKWAIQNSIKPSSFQEKVLYELFYEGLGNYYSLSNKWVTENGSLTITAQKTLVKLVPTLRKKLKSVLLGSQDKELVKGMSTGPFSKKWGALPIALWLSKETGRSPLKLREWVEKGPKGTLELLFKYAGI